MQYLGSKRAYAKKIVEVICEDSSCMPRITNVYDLCCGALSMSMAFIDAGFRSVHAVDACEPLVRMYESVRDGWVPPNELSAEEWAALRDEQDPTNPMTAFAGFGCSHGGLWFGCYAKQRQRPQRWASNLKTYAALATGSTLRRYPYLQLERMTLAYGDALAIKPKRGDLVYIDPPYEGTGGWYGTVEELDHVKLWTCCRTWRELGCRVYVSGYNAPPGFVRTHFVRRAVRKSFGNGKTENLYRLP